MAVKNFSSSEVSTDCNMRSGHKIDVEHRAFSWHKIPTEFKVVALPVISILALCFPVEFSFLMIFIQLIILHILKVSAKEQISYLKPVLYYALLLLFVDFVSICFESHFVWNEFLANLRKISLQSEENTFFMLVKIFAVLQAASVFFKTTTTLEVRSAIAKIDKFGKYRGIFTNTISMFINFIPLVARIWQESKRSWLARGGKSGIKMLYVLLPVLFSVGMKKAWNTARAIESRSD